MRQDALRRWSLGPLPRLGWFFVLILAVTAAWSAWVKGTGNTPEWTYHRLAAQPVFEGGLSIHNAGYLPGFAGFIAPFFRLPDPIGLALFIALGWLLCAVTVGLLYRDYWRADASRLGTGFSPWLAVWMILPLWLGVRNNQVMVWMMAPLLLAFAPSRDRRFGTNGALIAFAAVVKTLPLTLIPFLVVRRRLRLAVAAVLLSAMLSFLLAGWHFGWAESLQLHLDWPANAGGQDPLNALGAGGEPRFFSDNMSARAWIVRSATWIGAGAARWAAEGLLYGSFVLTGWMTWRRSGQRGMQRDLALWLAWIALASPFGRYYYTCMLLPAWCLLVRAPASWLRAIGWAGPVLALATRGDGLYAALAALTYGVFVAYDLRTQTP